MSTLAVPKKTKNTSFLMSIEEKLIPINIEDEMKSAYIDYSMSRNNDFV